MSSEHLGLFMDGSHQQQSTDTFAIISVLKTLCLSNKEEEAATLSYKALLESGKKPPKSVQRNKLEAKNIPLKNFLKQKAMEAQSAKGCHLNQVLSRGMTFPHSLQSLQTK